ncbi:MAG: uroporphyrinogen-III synthase [Ignavibacteriota bacterium]
MNQVLLTRPYQRIGEDNPFSSALRSVHIEVLEIPMITIGYPKETASLDLALQALATGGFDYCVLSSPTAIEYFHSRASELRIADAIRASVGFATVGAKSAEYLTRLGYKLTVPLPHQNAGAAALLIALRTFDIRQKRTLILQSQIAMPVLFRAFEMCGALIQSEILYETSGPTLQDSARLLQFFESEQYTRSNVVAFFSPSAVEYFVRTLAEMGSQYLNILPNLAAIGETTAKEIELLLRRRPEIVARKANQESLAQDIISYLQLRLN